MALTTEQIEALLKPKEVIKQSTQVGPLRWFDKEMTCTARRCGSSTYCKVQGMPLCMKHALEKLNKMLVEAGYKGVMAA